MLLSFSNAQSLHITIETKSEVYTVYTNDIIFVEARDRKITVYTTNGSYISIHSMNYWVDKLARLSFFQTHKSFLINLKYVCHFTHDTVYLYDNRFQAYLTCIEAFILKQYCDTLFVPRRSAAKQWNVLFLLYMILFLLSFAQNILLNALAFCF